MNDKSTEIFRQMLWASQKNWTAKPLNRATLWASKVFTKTSDPCMTFSGLTLMPLVRENAWERDAHLQKSPKWGRKSMNIFIIFLLNHCISHFFPARGCSRCLSRFCFIVWRSFSKISLQSLLKVFSFIGIFGPDLVFYF